jgi:hypothetical protein
VRTLIAGAQSGAPAYDAMSPQFAELTRQQLAQIQGLFGPMGELKSVTFREPAMMGGDAYNVVFANGALTMGVVLDPDGKIAGGIIQPAAAAGS